MRVAVGDRLQPVNGFGAPYLSPICVYEVTAIFGDGPVQLVELAGRHGRWPVLTFTFRGTPREPTAGDTVRAVLEQLEKDGVL